MKTTQYKGNVITYLKHFIQQNKRFDYVITNMHSAFITIKIKNTYNQNTIMTFFVSQSVFK